MSFIDSYKNLEKLCSEIYGDSHGVSAYIEEMLDKSDGSYYVSTWNEDLKQLKHYRWIRNKIVHEPECNEGNMCVPDDVRWLNDFYSRVMSANDPLALYHKARKSHKPKKQAYSSHSSTYAQKNYTKKSSEPAGCLSCLIVFSIVVAAIISLASLLVNLA